MDGTIALFDRVAFGMQAALPLAFGSPELLDYVTRLAEAGVAAALPRAVTQSFKLPIDFLPERGAFVAGHLAFAAQGNGLTIITDGSELVVNGLRYLRQINPALAGLELSLDGNDNFIGAFAEDVGELLQQQLDGFQASLAELVFRLEEALGDSTLSKYGSANFRHLRSSTPRHTK